MGQNYEFNLSIYISGASALFPNKLFCGLFCKKSRFVVEKGIDGGKNGLVQVFRNISGGNGGPVFYI